MESGKEGSVAPFCRVHQPAIVDVQAVESGLASHLKERLAGM